MKLVNLPIVLSLLVSAVAVAFVAINVQGSTSLPRGPVDVVWDHEVCAHCRMHIGEPAFAVQVQTEAGDVLNFDDPGCAFQLLEARAVETHAVYFRHRSEDRWISSDDVAFAAVAQSPMGFGFAAVDAGTPGAAPLAVARTKMLENR